MYDKAKSIIKVSSLELGNYVEGSDFFNSKFLYMFRKLPTNRTYKINTRDYRLDLLSLEIFGSDVYSELLLLYNGITISDLKTNMTLNVFAVRDLEDLITKLTIIQSPRDYLKTVQK